MPEDPRFLPPTPFSRLLMTHAASTCGDACMAVSLAGSLFFAKPGDAARGSLLLYLLLTMAPFAIVSPIMGPALDRIRGGRRLMVVLSAVGRAALCFAMAQFIIKPSPEGLMIYPLAFGVLVLSKTYSIARSAMVPALVEDKEELVKANSRLALISLLGGLVGGAPAFALQAIFDARFSLILGALVFTVAAVLATRIPRTNIVQDPGEKQLEHEEVQQPSVLLAASATAVLRGAVGFIVFFAAFAFHDDKLGLGVFAVSYGAGGFLGNIVAPAMRERFKEENLLAASLGFGSVLVLLGGITGGTFGFAISGIGVAVASAAGRLGFDSLLQRDGPDAARGRAFAKFETHFQIAWVVGALFGLIPATRQFGLLILAAVLLFAAVSYAGALRAARGRAPRRATIRPKVVDEMFDRARDEFRERRGKTRGSRRKSATERRAQLRDGATPADDQDATEQGAPPPPPPPKRRRPARASADPNKPFPRGS